MSFRIKILFVRVSFSGLITSIGEGRAILPQCYCLLVII